MQGIAFRFLAGLFLIVAFAGSAAAQLVDKKALTLAEAQKIAAAAEEEAKKNNFTMCIAVVDDGGHLLYFLRMDEAQFGSIEVSMAKARSAVMFKRPTKVFEDAVAGGRNAILSLRGAVPLEGGVPLLVNGKIIGAIGVSGATAQQDGQVAQAGAAILK